MPIKFTKDGFICPYCGKEQTKIGEETKQEPLLQKAVFKDFLAGKEEWEDLDNAEAQPDSHYFCLECEENFTPKEEDEINKSYNSI